MRAVYLFIIIISIVSCKSQAQEKLSFEELKTKTIEFLVKKNVIKEENEEDYKSNKYTFFLEGVINGLSEGELKNGMYAFGILSSHSKSFFVLVENNNYIILDISSREGLNNSITEILDYSERNKFCVNITTDYISRVIRVFYNKNKNPLAGVDTNCENGIRDTNELP